MSNKCLKVPVANIKKDSVLKKGQRGARKIIVTNIWKRQEKETKSDLWRSPRGKGKCPVWWMSNAEMAVFNQYTAQDRHYHKEGTEIYIVMEGRFIIEIDWKTYRLVSEDSIIVPPFSVHQVINKRNKYLCRVVTLNCRGDQDKFIV